MKADAIALLGSIFYKVKEARPVLQNHVFDDDNLIPHLIMGDLAFWVVDRFKTKGNNDSVCTNIINLLEFAFNMGEQDVDDVITTSFLENLPYPSESGNEIARLLGPKLRSQFAIMRPFQVPDDQ